MRSMVEGRERSEPAVRRMRLRLRLRRPSTAFHAVPLPIASRQGGQEVRSAAPVQSPSSSEEGLRRRSRGSQLANASIRADVLLPNPLP